MESPTAATDPGFGFQPEAADAEGDGDTEGEEAAGAFRDTPSPESPLLHPASAATPTKESADSAAPAVRIRGRVARSGILRSPPVNLWSMPLAMPRASPRSPGRRRARPAG
ncbi:hypothetical protein GCM10010298_06360 [Streptomyces microflavus]|uniref:Uncharacterized protein n=1 Tax=Streptomyces microflavus TaxID=1919 RepID=A0A7J0CMA2_STRMI|nr:hypothetical protein Smic_21860 [Streptomyces microflavus]GGX45767.1 hypothetical protein GCM10010298_06360 [Streptomyces microflavus]